MKDKILFYVEPHPIRNWFSEYRTVADTFINIARTKEFYLDYDWKIFLNNYVAKKLEEKISALCANEVILTTEEEGKQIDSFLTEWNQEEIEKRNDFINAKGEYFDFYYKLIERIYKDFPFNCVIIWSENGVVRKFAEDNNIKIIHMELGPTRKPVYPTLCIDPFGTNAFSSLRRAKNINLNSIVTNKDFWERVSLFSDKNENFLSAMECKLQNFSEEYLDNDKAITLKSFANKNYVIIGLQLTDDLNTQLHSEFNSPLDFLSKITPLIIDKGFDVIIKTHPMSHTRPYNLIKELEAISFVKDNYDKNVTVLDADIPQKYFIQLCANAKAVISINSSVSFESWLLGTPGLNLGESVYDNNNIILNKSNKFLTSGKITDDLLESSKIIEYALEKYFFPFDNSYIAEVLNKIISNYELFKTPDLYIKWLEDNIENHNFFSRKNIQEIEILKLLVSNSTSYSDIDQNFKYHLDRCIYENNSLKLSGWIFDANNVNDQLKLYLDIDGVYVELDYIYRESLLKHKPFLKLGLNPELKYGFYLSKLIELNENSKVRLLIITKEKNYYLELTEKLIITEQNKQFNLLKKQYTELLLQSKSLQNALKNNKLRNEELKKFSIGKYIKYKIISELTFGNMRRKYKEKYQEQKILYRLIKRNN